MARQVGRLSAGLIVALLVLGARCAFAQAVALIGNHPATAVASLIAGDAPPGRSLVMETGIKPQNSAGLATLLAQQQNPSSPQYHRWLATGEFARRFGAAQSDFDGVAQWLGTAGFTIIGGNPAAGYIRFTGSVALAEGAFATRIATFGNGTLYANTTDPSIPAGFDGVITGIRGLDNFGRTQALSRLREARAAPGSPVPIEPVFLLASLIDSPAMSAPRQPPGSGPAVVAGGLGPAFGPSDMYTFYDETPLLDSGNNGGGANADCLAIISDSDYLADAINAFNAQFGLSPSDLTTVLADGTDPGFNNDEAESLLDLEWAHAAAPGAALEIYLGDPAHSTIDSITDALKKAVQDNTCGAIGVSFGYCGEPDTFYSGTLDPILSQAASQGQSVLVASGDSGAAASVLDSKTQQCVPGDTQGVSELAADPNVTAVGGTSFLANFDSNGDDIGYVLESVWDGSVGASGGGESAIFPKPAYQAGPGVPADGMRDVPDVAMIASPSFPGVFLGNDSTCDAGNCTGQGPAVIDCCVGGTSLSVQIWNGISKLLAEAAGGRVGNLNSGVYQLNQINAAAAGFRDVTSGSNGFNGVAGFPAGPGYDQSTGWGTIDISGFVSAFTGPWVGVTGVVDQSVTPGQTIGAGTFQLDNRGSQSLNVTAVAIDLSNPRVFSSLSLSASVNGAPSVTVTSAPASAATFSFSPPLTVPTGQSVIFSLEATAASAGASSHTVAHAFNSSSPRAVGAVAGSALVGLLAMVLPMGGMQWRRRWRALLLAIAVMATVQMVGCRGGGGGGGSSPPPPSSTQTIPATGIGATAGGAPVNPAGLPATLGTVVLL